MSKKQQQKFSKIVHPFLGCHQEFVLKGFERWRSLGKKN